MELAKGRKDRNENTAGHKANRIERIDGVKGRKLKVTTNDTFDYQFEPVSAVEFFAERAPKISFD